MARQVQHPVAVANFTAISGNELDEVFFESNASSNIRAGRVGVTANIRGENLVLSVG